jgi:hypothetical protein
MNSSESSHPLHANICAYTSAPLSAHPSPYPSPPYSSTYPPTTCDASQDAERRHCRRNVNEPRELEGKCTSLPPVSTSSINTMWSMNAVSVFLAALTPWQTSPTTSTTFSATRDLSSFVTDLMERYEIPGVAIALVRSPDFTQDGKWFKETTGFGIRNAAGDPMEADVSGEMV